MKPIICMEKIVSLIIIVNHLLACRENRYVLFLTENYAALDILKNPKNYLSHEMSASIPGAGASEQHSKDIQPYILFGSSFPKDKEYTQVYIN